MTAYTFTDIPLNNYANSSAVSINSSGTIVGSLSDSSGRSDGFAFTNGLLTQIDVPNAYSTNPDDINDRGIIVGQVSSPANNDASGYIDNSGTFSSITIPNATFIHPFRINNVGQIAGTYNDQNGVQSGFIYFNGAYRTFGFGNNPLSVSDLNDFGSVVGSYKDDNGSYHGYVDNRVVLKIDAPNATDTFVSGINNSGEVVGDYFSKDGVEHGFSERNGSYDTIDIPGATDTAVTSVNDSGDLAGYYFDSNSRQHGFVQRNGELTTVDDPNGYDTYIARINDAGQITGRIINGGFTTAFVASLTPPTISGTMAGQQTEGETRIAPFAKAIVTDPNEGTQTLTISFSGGGGTLSGTGITANPDGTYQLTGTAAAVTAELDALSFTPTAPAPGTSATTSFTLTDVSSTSSPGTVSDSSTTVTDTANAASTGTAGSTGSTGVVGSGGMVGSGTSSGTGGAAGSTGAGSGAGTPADAVAVDQAVTFQHGVFTLTGHASSANGVRSIEVSAVVDGASTVLGAAAVNADGTFSFADAIGAVTQGFITATETDLAGVTASGQAGYSLTGGLGKVGNKGQQVSYTADGTAETAVDTFKPNGSQTVTVQAAGQTFTSSYRDTFNNGGQPETTFVFNPGHGLDVLSLFRPDGVDHDTLSFKGSDFNNDIANVLANTAYQKGGAVITDPTSGDTVRLVGVTKKELTAYARQDVTFHA